MTLSADDSSALADNYQYWIGSVERSTGLNRIETWDLETVRVDLSSFHEDYQSLYWLSDFVSSYNAKGAGYMDLELNTDKLGQTLSLEDFFASGTDDIFTALNLGGENANFLDVNCSLASIGIDEFTFKVNGEEHDTVQLSSDWFFIGDDTTAEGPSYSYVVVQT